MTTGTATPAKLTLQGVDVPAASINKAAFFALTRRKRNTEYSRAFAGHGNTDNIELRKADILAGIHVRFSGTLTVALGGGTAATTMRWPHDLLRTAKFTANGQSNLINCSGAKLKVREQLANGDISDRGVPQIFGAATVNQGTLSMASESWGVGTGGTAIAGGTYNVDLYWYVPVAEDHKDLAGAIFAQTSTMDLTLSLEWESAANLFVTTGAATMVLAGNVIVETEKYSIPMNGGLMVVPDLSLYHSLIQTRVATGVSNGDNELRLIGQGAGKQLLRIIYQTWNGAGAAAVPLAANATNYGQQGWRYSSNETPELFTDGRSLREWNERCANADIGAIFGFLCHDFASINAFRDAVDMGQTSELRALINIGAGVVLTSPAVEYVQETVFSAGSGG